MERGLGMREWRSWGEGVFVRRLRRLVQGDSFWITGIEFLILIRQGSRR